MRFLSLLLVMICAGNSLGVDGSFISQYKGKKAALESQLSTGISPTSKHEATYETLPTDRGHSDCETGADCHQCHLGHCLFVLETTRELKRSDLSIGFEFPFSNNEFIVYLSGPRKPPRA